MFIKFIVFFLNLERQLFSNSLERVQRHHIFSKIMMKPPNIFVYPYQYPALAFNNNYKQLSIDQISTIVDQSLPVNSFTVASLSEERLRRTTPQTFFDYTQLLILYGNPSVSTSFSEDSVLDLKLSDYVARGGRVLCFGPPPPSITSQFPSLLSSIPASRPTVSVELPESMYDKLNCRNIPFYLIGSSLFQCKATNSPAQPDPVVLNKFLYFSNTDAAAIISFPERSLAISLVCTLIHLCFLFLDVYHIYSKQFGKNCTITDTSN